MQIKEATSGFLLPCTLHCISQELAKNLPLWLSQAFSIFQAGEGHLGLQPGLLSLPSQVMELLKDCRQRVGLTASARQHWEELPWSGCHWGCGAGRADPARFLPFPVWILPLIGHFWKAAQERHDTPYEWPRFWGPHTLTWPGRSLLRHTALAAHRSFL